MTFNDQLQENAAIVDNYMQSVRPIANFMGWEDSPYPNLPNKVYAVEGTLGKHLSQFKYSSSWDEFMPVYSEISRAWLAIPDYKKKKFKGTPTYRAIQNRILLSSLIEAFELAVAFVNEWNASEFKEIRQQQTA
jgi:hypothetical protein